jgi:Flp pilus assembly pilin Flp
LGGGNPVVRRVPADRPSSDNEALERRCVTEPEVLKVGIVEQVRLLFSGATERIVVTREERGQAMVEYALLIGFITISGILGLTAIGINVADLLSQVQAGFP